MHNNALCVNYLCVHGAQVLNSHTSPTRPQHAYVRCQRSMAGASGHLLQETMVRRSVPASGERAEWDQELVFRGVQLRESLRVTLLDRRLIGSDVVLGQVCDSHV